MTIRFAAGAHREPRDAYAAFWTHRLLHGPYATCRVNPRRDSPLDARALAWTDVAFGVARLRKGALLPIVSSGYEQEPGAFDAPELCLWLYEGDLRRAYDIGSWPLADGREHRWTRDVHEWFLELGQAIYSRARFSGAAIGFELDSDVIETSTKDVPATRYCGYLVPEGSALLSFPPSFLGAPMSTGF